MKIKDNDIRAIGAFGEELALKYLKKNRYSIVARNVIAGHSEIDIIAERERTLVFVEVKTRSSEDERELTSRPADAVNKDKTSYLIRGVHRFCTDSGTKYADYFKRIDIIEVYLTKRGNSYKPDRIEHFESAVGSTQ